MLLDEACEQVLEAIDSVIGADELADGDVQLAQLLERTPLDGRKSQLEQRQSLLCRQDRLAPSSNGPGSFLANSLVWAALAVALAHVVGAAVRWLGLRSRGELPRARRCRLRRRL